MKVRSLIYGSREYQYCYKELSCKATCRKLGMERIENHIGLIERTGHLGLTSIAMTDVSNTRLRTEWSVNPLDHYTGRICGERDNNVAKCSLWIIDNC